MKEEIIKEIPFGKHKNQRIVLASYEVEKVGKILTIWHDTYKNGKMESRENIYQTTLTQNGSPQQPIRVMTKSKPFVAHCCEYCGRVLSWERDKCPYCKTELVD